jgi:hypothetical protein
LLVVVEVVKVVVKAAVAVRVGLELHLVFL